MSEKINGDQVSLHTDAEHTIMLPCPPKHFADFLLGLLGKPQTIGKNIAGSFELTQDAAIKLHERIVERVEGQNQGVLIQFGCRIALSDSSSHSLNSFDAFKSFGDPNAVVSTAAYFNWEFLIHFPGRPAPERQQVEVSFVTARGRHAPFFDEDIPFFFSHAGVVNIRIRHTLRSWGGDMESMISRHIETIVRPETGVKDFCRRHNERIGNFVGLLFFATSVGASLVAVGKFSTTQMQLVSALFNAHGVGNNANSAQPILQYMARGDWSIFLFRTLVYLVISALVAYIFSTWTTHSLNNSDPSFVLLTQESFVDKAKILSRVQRKWQSFFGSIVANLICGVVANYVFAKYVW